MRTIEKLAKIARKSGEPVDTMNALEKFMTMEEETTKN